MVFEFAIEKMLYFEGRIFVEGNTIDEAKASVMEMYNKNLITDFYYSDGKIVDNSFKITGEL